MANPGLAVSHELKTLLDQVPMGLLLVDSEGRISEVNRPAEVMFAYARRELIGQPVELLIPDRLRYAHTTLREEFVARPEVRPMGAGRDLFAMRRDATEFPVEIGLGPAEVSGAPFILCCVADISIRKRLLEERETLLRDLQHALDEVRRLSGLLPICASCRKIRDEVGRWRALEEYVVDHSEAEFSHGLCPDCAVQLYPQYFKKE